MNAKVIGAIVLVVVVLGGGYLVMSRTRTSETAVSTGNNEVKTSGDSSKYATVGDAATSGKSLKCTYAQAGSANSARATYYFSGGNIRAEITANNTTSFMIIAKDTIQTWNDLTVKPHVATLAKSSGAVGEAVVTSMLRSPLTGFTCTETSVDAKLFIAPA